MAIIGSAAYLYVCACGKHGKIFTAKGAASLWVCSKEAACATLCQFAERGEIAEYEMGEVLRQIDVSSLEETDKDVEPINRITTKIVNARERMFCDAHDETGPPPKWVH